MPLAPPCSPAIRRPARATTGGADHFLGPPYGIAPNPTGGTGSVLDGQRDHRGGPGQINGQAWAAGEIKKRAISMIAGGPLFSYSIFYLRRSTIVHHCPSLSLRRPRRSLYLDCGHRLENCRESRTAANCCWPRRQKPWLYQWGFDKFGHCCERR